MRYTINVTAFSKCILKKEYCYENNAILIDRRDMLYYQLNPLRSSLRDNGKKLHTMCTETIDIICNKPLPTNVNKSGMYLHEYHRNQLIKFIEAQQLANVTVSKAIDNWYKLYDMDEDIMNQDAIFRMWQRYIRDRKKSPDFARIHDIKNAIKPVVPRTDDQVKEIFDKLALADLPRFFNPVSNDMNFAAVKKLWIYIRVKYQLMSVNQVARMYRYHYINTYRIVTEQEKWANKLGVSVLD